MNRTSTIDAVVRLGQLALAFGRIDRITKFRDRVEESAWKRNLKGWRP